MTAAHEARYEFLKNNWNVNTGKYIPQRQGHNKVSDLFNKVKNNKTKT